MNTQSLETTARKYMWYGLSIIPIGARCESPISSWEAYQKRTMSDKEVKSSFIRGRNIAIISGTISGNLECLNLARPTLFQSFLDTIEYLNPELRRKLTIWQETPSGGNQLIYRCTGKIGKSCNLAMEKYHLGSGDIQDPLIDTKSEGGFFLVAPSSCIPKGGAPDSPCVPCILHGDLAHIPRLQPEELNLLHLIARSFDENLHLDPPRAIDSEIAFQMVGMYNRETDWHTLLERYGWKYIRSLGARQHWQRPGKAGNAISATLGGTGLFVYSASTCLPQAQHLDKFSVYAWCEHSGAGNSYSVLRAAAKSLYDWHKSE